MVAEDRIHKSLFYLKHLCKEIPGRCVGSEGNRIATRFFQNEIKKNSWHTDKDNVEIVDCKKVVEISEALNYFVRALP